ncbi:MAG TPA: type IV toxin-antitoxin system AbiEi family antitoxin [Candidatus Baltobacteraceae bacterium]|jgi:hypothetical protein|nr:type IV toxin-antitoxin system AbiEi family antitoxin [Candidatus Baltobacteraceae bacterium]
MATGPRRISTHLAPIVELLELEQPSIVTVKFLADALRRIEQPTDPRVIAKQLQRAGWLLSLRTRGAWEFAPAARAGAISGGDRYIELRATLLRRPLDVALAHDSAAWLHSLGTRPPMREILTAPEGLKIPVALSDYRIVREPAVLLAEKIDRLPVWKIETLLVKMAISPSSFRDWSGVIEWLEKAFARVNEANLRQELRVAGPQAWIRLAYMADRANQSRLADELSKEVEKPAGPIYLGRRSGRQHFVAKYDLVDALLLPSMKAS